MNAKQINRKIRDARRNGKEVRVRFFGDVDGGFDIIRARTVGDVIEVMDWQGHWQYLTPDAIVETTARQA